LVRGNALDVIQQQTRSHIGRGSIETHTHVAHGGREHGQVELALIDGLVLCESWGLLHDLLVYSPPSEGLGDPRIPPFWCR